MTRPLLALALAASTLVPVARAGEADASEFFRRLESIGLDTTRIRQVRSELELYFRESSDVAEAEYAFIRNNLYIPPSFKEPDSDRIRFDLETHHLQTVIHEFSHADLDFADCSAAEGTAEREHCEVHRLVREDLANDPNHRFVGLSRYTRMKADEVTSYFIGKAIGYVFDAVNDLVLWNKFMAPRHMSAEQLRAAGDRFLLPPADTQDLNGQRILAIRFGFNTVYDDARFQASSVSGAELIRWNETGRDEVKRRAYFGIMKLDPPADLPALVERLNRLDNAWLRGVRAELAAARAARIAQLRPASGAPADPGPAGSAPLGQGRR